jgi:hypothetical protein
MINKENGRNKKSNIYAPKFQVRDITNLKILVNLSIGQDFRIEVNFTRLKCYAASSGNSFPKFRDNLTVPFSRVNNTNSEPPQCNQTNN